MEADELTYTGDTTKFSDFYDISKNKDAAINEILTANNVTVASEIVKDSNAHTTLKNDFADLILDYNAEKALFEAISAEDIVVKEDPKPIKYISVQSIVDEVFTGIDFEANLKESTRKIVQTRASTRDVSRYLAFDYLNNAGTCSLYVEDYNVNTGSKLVSRFTVSMDTTKIANYLTLSQDFNSMIEKMLADESVTPETQIDKNSSQVSEIREGLNNLKSKYLAEKTLFESTQKANITASNILSPATFDSVKMTELGISDMNAFAEALLNNTKRRGYEHRLDNG